MSTDTNPEKEIDSAVLMDELPDNPICSLRQIQALYGALAQAEMAAEHGGELGGDDRVYYTPHELDKFVNESESDDGVLVSVKVDLTGAEPEYEGLEYIEFSKAIVPRLGYSRYDSGRGIDHSITHRGAKDGSNTNTVLDYCIDRLVRWTDADDREPSIGAIASAEDGHPDGWVIRNLAALGQSEGIEDAIETELETLHSGTPLVTSTVKLRLDPDDLADPGPVEEVGWYYPGELPVLNEAMKARKREKLVEKNVDTPSQGEAACQVTNSETTVVGTADVPLDLYTPQHAEHFPHFQQAEAWRQHSLSTPAALLLKSGTSFIDACKTTREGLGIYALPYFVSLDRNRAELLYLALSRLREREPQDGSQNPMKSIVDTIDNLGSDADVEALRFYVINIENNKGDVRVFKQAPDATIYPPLQVAQAHQAVLESPLFGDGGFPLADNETPLNPGRGVGQLVDDVVSGWYAKTTLPQGDDTDSDDDGPVSDDPIEHVTFAILTETDINPRELFDKYVERIVAERNSDDNDERAFPRTTVALQFAQYVALERASLLSTDQTYSDTPHMNELTTPTDNDGTDADEQGMNDIIQSQLDSFLAERPPIQQNDELRGAFLFGAYLGVVANHQSLPKGSSGRGMNRTVLDRVTIDQLTPEDIEPLLTDLKPKEAVYARDAGFGDSLAAPIRNQLFDTLTRSQPRDWDIPRSQFQFFVVAGETYGERVIEMALDARPTTDTDANN